MDSPLRSISRREVRFGFFIAVAAVIISFVLLKPGSSESAANGLINRTQSRAEDIVNYDIREDKTAGESLFAYRSKVGTDAASVADIRDGFVRGEEKLRQRVPTLRVEYNTDLRIPEVIAPDVRSGKAALSRATDRRSVSRTETLRAFLSENADLVGADARQVAELRTVADYTNPDGGLSFVVLAQEVGGVPVFRGEVKAGFNRQGEMFRVINNLAPGMNNVSADFGDPSSAVAAAGTFVGTEKNGGQLASQNYEQSTADKAVFGEGDSATVAEKIYFPIEPGVLVPAWRVLIWQPVNAYYVIVDANTGTMLWRKNLTEDQNQPATYSVYTRPNSTAMMPVARNPFPMTPGPLAPNGVQAPGIKRMSVERIGNEGVYSFNSLGWIPDGSTKTDGNAIQAGLDRDGTDGVDPNSEAVSPTREFRYNYRPFDPNGGTMETPPVPVPQTYPGSAFQQGSVTQLFYIGNWWHDATYLLGFTEAAGNFQDNNFNRGGLGGDRVRGEGQDSSGTNNANFSTPADGTRPRMQMYLWTAPNPDIDGNLDADVVVHEITHGLSQRLHGNSSGLSLDIARGMGEGFSDFYAHCLMADPSEPINGIYTIGAYDTHLSGGVGLNNNYYGIRRFPKAVMSFTGGPNNRPHNPLTFRDIDSTTMNLSDGAYAPAYTGTADQVHNIGEVWSIALWEVRARMMQRLGNAVGNRRVLQFVTDGMKLAPLNPTPITERDAMISAALASGTAADVEDIWAGFALRGLGSGASIQVRGGVSTGGLGTVRVTEAFDLPNLTQSPAITISDAAGNQSGFPDPGETITLTVPLTNSTGRTATGTTLQLVGGSTQNYGTITHGGTVSQSFTYTVPAATPCGGLITLTFNANSSLGALSFTRTIAVGSTVTTFTENFDGVTAPAIPAGWTVASSLPAMTFVTTAASPDTAPNSVFAADPTATGGSTELTSPFLAVASEAAKVSFRHSFSTEAGWDGGVLEISIAGGAFQDIITAGGTFLQNGYNDFLTTSTGNPMANRPGWSGNSGGYITSVVRLPAAAAGQSVQLRWRFGADNNTAPAGGGWHVDTVQFAGSYSCAPAPITKGVEITGVVVAPAGYRLRNAMVGLTNEKGVTRSVISGTRGVFTFTGIPAGRTYVLSVNSRRFKYAPVVLNVVGPTSGIELRPE